jgi:hypothetical protein
MELNCYQQEITLESSHPPFRKLIVSHKSSAGYKEGGMNGAIETLA